MTKELQTIQRQVIEKGVSLPSNTAFSGIQNAFNAVSKMGTFAAEQIAVKQAGVEGSQAAFDEKGPRKLAPGFTKATQAYNNAYNNTQTTLLSLDGSAMMDEKLREMASPGRLNSNSVAQYSEVAKGVIEGTLQGTSPENKADVALRLTQHLFQNQNRMANAVQAFNNQRLESDFKFILDQTLKEAKESTFSGDKDGLMAAKASFDALIKDQKALGLMDDNQELAMREAFNDTLITSDFARQYLESRATGTEEKFLLDLATKQPADLSFDQWQKVSSQVLSLKSTQDRLVNEEESLAYAKWNQLVDTNQIKTLSDLDEAQAEMSALNFTKLQTKFLKQQQAAAANDLKVGEFLNLNVTNPARANGMGDKVKTAAYDMAIDAATQRKRAETGDPNARLNLTEKADVVSSFTVPMPAFNNELNYALSTQTVDTAQAVDALRAYKRLAGTPGKLERSPVLSLDKQSEQIAVSALLQAEHSALDPVASLDNARASILNADDIVRQGRMARYNEKYGAFKTGTKNTKKLFKEIFDADADDNPTAFTAMREVLRINASEMQTLDEAVEFTKRQLVNTQGKSKYGSSSKELMFAPPEKVIPFVDNGHWFDNQFVMTVNQVANNFERRDVLAKDLDANVVRLNKVQDELKKALEVEKEPTFRGSFLDTLERQQDIAALVQSANDLTRDINVGRFSPATKIKWGLPNQKVPTNLTEGQILSEPLLRVSQREQLAVDPLNPEASEATLRLFGNTKPKLEIDGEVRDIFLMSDASTMNRDNGKVTYGLYYKDQFGFTQPVPDPFNPRGVAEWGVTPFDDFLSATSAEMSDKTISQVAKKEAMALFDRDNPRRVIVESLPFVGNQVQLDRLFEQQEFIKEEQPKIEERLKEKRDKRKGGK